MFFIRREFSYVLYQEKIQLCFLLGENLVMFFNRRKFSYVFIRRKFSYAFYQEKIQLCCLFTAMVENAISYVVS